jgi:very-short-patch-repair endonuclease
VNFGDALLRAALDEDVEVSAPCFDWAFASGRLDLMGFESIMRALPVAGRSIRDWVDPDSQSVLESVARVRIRKRGWTCRSQVRVGDSGAIDLVIEDQVALELDGRAFHESTFESDRRKDLAITLEGRHALRVSKPMLLEAWPQIEEAVGLALAARGRSVGITGKESLRPRGNRRSPGRGELFT